jgi:hypothetical protein
MAFDFDDVQLFNSYFVLHRMWRRIVLLNDIMTFSYIWNNDAMTWYRHSWKTHERTVSVVWNRRTVVVPPSRLIVFFFSPWPNNRYEQQQRHLFEGSCFNLQMLLNNRRKRNAVPYAWTRRRFASDCIPGFRKFSNVSLRWRLVWTDSEEKYILLSEILHSVKYEWRMTFLYWLTRSLSEFKIQFSHDQVVTPLTTDDTI